MQRGGWTGGASLNGYSTKRQGNYANAKDNVIADIVRSAPLGQPSNGRTMTGQCHSYSYSEYDDWPTHCIGTALSNRSPIAGTAHRGDTQAVMSWRHGRYGPKGAPLPTRSHARKTRPIATGEEDVELLFHRENCNNSNSIYLRPIGMSIRGVIVTVDLLGWRRLPAL